MPSLGRTLLDALRGGRPADELAQIAASYGSDPTAAMAQSDVNRDVMPGAKTPDAALREPADAAQIDRYIWGQQAGVGGLPTAVYSELVKVPAVQGAMRHVTRGIGAVTGFPEAEKWYSTDETSSPPSLGNVLAYTQGALDPRLGPSSSLDSSSSPALAYLRGLFGN